MGKGKIQLKSLDFKDNRAILKVATEMINFEANRNETTFIVITEIVKSESNEDNTLIVAMCIFLKK